MPERANRSYSPDLKLPPCLKTSDEVWIIRFTGEVFLDYRLYIAKLQQYTQRVWTNKKSKASGLTFEEALIGETSGARVACNGQVDGGLKDIEGNVDDKASTPTTSTQTHLRPNSQFHPRLQEPGQPPSALPLSLTQHPLPQQLQPPLAADDIATPPSPILAVPVEEKPEDMEENIKNIVAKVLKAVGSFGASIGYLLQRVHDLHVRVPWPDPLSADSAFSSLISCDQRFVEVSPQHFALRELITKPEGQEESPSGEASNCQSDGSSTSTDDQSYCSDDPTITFERNNDFCSKCHKLYSEDYSPLLLCDTCPRVVHLMCAELDWKQLPEPTSQFYCPRCQAKGSAQDSEYNLEMTEEEWEAFGTLDKEERSRLREKLCNGREAHSVQEEPRPGSSDPFDDLEVMEEQHNFVWRMEQIRDSMPSSSPLAKEFDKRIAKARLEAEGPQGLEPMVAGKAELQSLMDALCVVEFLSTFQNECEANVISLETLYKAVVWPMEGNTLTELYIALLRCVLLDQVTQSGSTRSRAKRWARVVDSATWPEILKRYLLASRKSAGLHIPNVHMIPVGEMDDHSVGVRAARDLMVMPFYKLKPELHLRLLHALCNDIVNSQGMKSAMTTRIEEVYRLTAEKYHADAEDRKKDRVRKQILKKGKRKHPGSQRIELVKRAKPDCGDEAGQADGQGSGIVENGGDYGDVDANGEIEDAESKATMEERRQRDRGFRTQIGNRSVRTEPAGFDRHHRRYWLFRGFRSCVCVEEPDGLSLGCITNREGLDDLLCRLNEDGSREQILSKSLRAVYNELVETFAEPEIPLDITKVRAALESKDDQSRTSPEEAEREAMWSIVRSGVRHLEKLVTGLTNAGVEMDIGIKDWRCQFRSVCTVPGLSALLFNLETTVCHLADGLPKGADDMSLNAVLNQESTVFDGSLISALQEFDDSDTDDQTGADSTTGTRKKRSSLWRTAQERLVWLRLMNDVRRTSSGSLGAYLAALLNDRAQPLIQDIARKQQAVEKAAEQEVAAAAVPRARKSARLNTTASSCTNLRAQRSRGRTAKVEASEGRKVLRKRRKDCVRDSAKEMEPVGEDTTDERVPKRSRNSRTPTRLTARGVHGDSGEVNGGTAVERAPDDRWDYICSVCKHGGEMLCCEAPNCTVAMHMECIGLSSVPFGSWYCPICSDQQQPECLEASQQTQ